MAASGTENNTTSACSDGCDNGSVVEVIVYMATNTVTGHCYIGITSTSLKKRRSSHLSAALRGEDGSPYFYRAIRAHGSNAFTWQVISAFPTLDQAAREEMRLIAEMRPKYNASPGGDGVAGVGSTASEEARKKMSAAKIGRPGPWTGKKRSAESIAKRTATRALSPVRPWLGKKRDASTMEKIAMVNRKWVVCLDDGKIYHGLQAAASAYGITRYRDIARVCIGKAKSTRGLRFEYLGAQT